MKDTCSTVWTSKIRFYQENDSVLTAWPVRLQSEKWQPTRLYLARTGIQVGTTQALEWDRMGHPSSLFKTSVHFSFISPSGGCLIVPAS